MRKQNLLLGLVLVSVSCSHNTPDVTPVPVPKPVASFTVPTSAQATVALNVLNTSTNFSSYALSWGDGTSTTDSAPSLSHTYTILGNVRLRLTATGPGGTDTLSKVLAITAPPNPVATAIAGKYKGQLYCNSYGRQNPVTNWKRDTTIQFNAIDSKTLLFF